MKKGENKKWFILGAAILLVTVLIAVVINLPFKNEIEGGAHNAAVISSGTEVQLVETKLSAYAVKKSNPVHISVPSPVTNYKTYYDSEGMIAVYQTKTGIIVYCVELGNPIGLSKGSSRTVTNNSSYWKSLSEYKRESIGLVTVYGYPNKTRGGYSKNDQYAATQILIWEFQQGWRTNYDAVPTNKEIYNRWVKNNVKAVYESILKDMRNHKLPSFENESIKLKYNSSSKKYEGSITDKNGVLASTDISCPQGLECTKSGNTLSIKSSNPITMTKEIGINKSTPTGINQGQLIIDNGKQQRMIIGKPSVNLTGKLKVTSDVLGKITIKKKTEDNSTDTFEFKITGPNGYSNKVKVKGGESVELNNLALGTYIIKEINTPARYNAASDMIILTSIIPERTSNIYNSLKNTSSVKIAKVDSETGNRIAGAKLTLEKKVVTWITVSSWTSTTDWFVVSDKLEVGKQYRVCEKAAPTGYVKSNGCKEFKINSKTDSIAIEIPNTKGETVITKVDENGKPLAGAQLLLKDKNGNKIGDVWETTGTSNKLVKGLKEGEKYTLVEVKAPDGYVKANDITFTAKAGETITMKNEKTELIISKQDITTGKEIAGAHLQVINSAGKVVDEWDSEEGKSHSIKGLTIGEKYTLKETVAPNGYSISNSITFVFDTNKKKVVMKDEQLYVEISKQDATTGKEIAGAELEVIDSSGKVIDKWTSVDGQSHKISNLVYGQTYTLRETTAPDGYSVSEEVTFVAGSTNKVVMKDDPTKVIIKKLDTTTKKRVVGATLQILDEDNKVIKEWVTTDKDLVITNLLVGKQYYVKEVKVPENYLQAEVVGFKIEKGQNSIEVVVNNTPIIYVPNTAKTVDVIMIVAGAIIALGGVGTIIWIRKRSA